MWPAIATLGAGFLNWFGQHQANKSAQQMARESMNFQHRETSSAYQRGMADMRAAGLNPMLAYRQGGASSGSGASSTPLNEFSSALAVRQSLADIKQTEAQTSLILANARAVAAGLPKKELVGEAYSTAQSIWRDVKAGLKGEFKPKKMDKEPRYF